MPASLDDGDRIGCPLIISDEWRPWFAPPCQGRFIHHSWPGPRVVLLHRIARRSSANVPAVGAFEDSQIRPVAVQSDADQRHATLARRAGWPGYRNQRRFWTRVDLGHEKLLPTWRRTHGPEAAAGSRFAGCDATSMRSFPCPLLLNIAHAADVGSRTVQYCSAESP